MKANTKDQGAHVALEEAAIRMAYTVLCSRMEFGIEAENDFADHCFPTPQLCKVSEILRAILDAGKRGWTYVMGELVEHPQDVRDVVVEAASVANNFAPLPPHACKKAVAALRNYHRVKSRQLLLWKLRDASPAGEEITEIIAELVALGSESGETRAGFPLSLADEIQDVAEAADFVEGILTDGTASVIYGPSNLGKTFWVLDIAACVATGRNFRDVLETEQGAVVYVALEGTQGIRNRILALRQAGKLPEGSPFFLCYAPISLLEPGHAEKLAATVKAAAMQSKLPCRLVVIDTLSRAMAGGDENGAQDMTLAVQSIDKVKQATGAHVLVIHHCGKDEAKGARGHSSLRAAVDTEIELFRPKNQTITTVKITKQRDMPTGEAMPFSLNVVKLGTDRRGNSITSCTVRHEDSIMADKGEKTESKGLSRKAPPERVIEVFAGSNSKIARQELIARTAALCKCSLRTAQDAVKEAEGLELIERIEKPTGRGGLDEIFYRLGTDNQTLLIQ